MICINPAVNSSHKTVRQLGKCIHMPENEIYTILQSKLKLEDICKINHFLIHKKNDLRENTLFVTA